MYGHSLAIEKRLDRLLGRQYHVDISDEHFMGLLEANMLWEFKTKMRENIYKRIAQRSDKDKTLDASGYGISQMDEEHDFRRKERKKLRYLKEIARIPCGTENLQTEFQREQAKLEFLSQIEPTEEEPPKPKLQEEMEQKVKSGNSHYTKYRIPLLNEMDDSKTIDELYKISDLVVWRRDILENRTFSTDLVEAPSEVQEKTEGSSEELSEVESMESEDDVQLSTKVKRESVEKKRSVMEISKEQKSDKIHLDSTEDIPMNEPIEGIGTVQKEQKVEETREVSEVKYVEIPKINDPQEFKLLKNTGQEKARESASRQETEDHELKRDGKLEQGKIDVSSSLTKIKQEKCAKELLGKEEEQYPKGEEKTKTLGGDTIEIDNKVSRKTYSEVVGEGSCDENTSYIEESCDKEVDTELIQIEEMTVDSDDRSKTTLDPKETHTGEGSKHTTSEAHCKDLHEGRSSEEPFVQSESVSEEQRPDYPSEGEQKPFIEEEEISQQTSDGNEDKAYEDDKKKFELLEEKFQCHSDTRNEDKESELRKENIEEDHSQQLSEEAGVLEKKSRVEDKIILRRHGEQTDKNQEIVSSSAIKEQSEDGQTKEISGEEAVITSKDDSAEIHCTGALESKEKSVLNEEEKASGPEYEDKKENFFKG